MANYNNMSDADLLSMLNTMADKFEQGIPLGNPVQQEQNYKEPQPVNAASWEEMEIELNDVPGNSGSVYSEPEQEMPVVNPLYTMDKDGNIVFSNMRPSQQQSKNYAHA